MPIPQFCSSQNSAISTQILEVSPLKIVSNAIFMVALNIWIKVFSRFSSASEMKFVWSNR
jgi:hypothetical protein